MPSRGADDFLWLRQPPCQPQQRRRRSSNGTRITTATAPKSKTVASSVACVSPNSANRSACGSRRNRSGAGTISDRGRRARPPRQALQFGRHELPRAVQIHFAANVEGHVDVQRADKRCGRRRIERRLGPARDLVRAAHAGLPGNRNAVPAVSYEPATGAARNASVGEGRVRVLFAARKRLLPSWCRAEGRGPAATELPYCQQTQAGRLHPQENCKVRY